MATKTFFFFFSRSAHFHLLSFTFFLYFQTLFISCACFPFAATKQHQAIFKHGCLLKWNLTSHQPLQKRSVKLYKRHRNKISNTIQLFCIRTCTQQLSNFFMHTQDKHFTQIFPVILNSQFFCSKQKAFSHVCGWH